MKRQLGGDRLGSGNKMEVEMRRYEKSNHDLGFLWRSTMSAGTIVPFLKLTCNRGDDMEIDLEAYCKTLPLIGPLLGSMKIQLDVFLCPWRLYQGQLHNNALGIGLKMDQVKLPVLKLDALPVVLPAEDLDNSQINPSCILAYLGIRGVGLNYTNTANLKREFNAIGYLAYWDIVKNYYANKQEELGAVVHTPKLDIEFVLDSVEANGSAFPLAGTGTAFITLSQPSDEIQLFYTGTVPDARLVYLIDENGVSYAVSDLVQGGFRFDTGPTVMFGTYNFNKYGTKTFTSYRLATSNDMPAAEIGISTFPLENLDKMRNKILSATEITTPFDVRAQNLTPYSYVIGSSASGSNMMPSQEGLAVKTYLSDIFNNWLLTEYIDGPSGINEITSIDTSSGSFSLDTLNIAKKVYDMLNRIAVSGGSYYDYLDATYTEMESRPVETPMYMGGLVRELIFDELVSMSESQGSAGTQVLGTLAGRGAMGGQKLGGKINIMVTEPSYIIGLVSITPRLDYSQGNDFDIHLQSLADLHRPALDEIGFQDLITEKLAWWDTKWIPASSAWVENSAGKQPAWLDYMTNYNKVYGNFAVKTKEQFMILSRRYEYSETAPETGIMDLTTYIDPRKFNYIFAESDLQAQNYWMQIAVDVNARRTMSAKLMPNI